MRITFLDWHPGFRTDRVVGVLSLSPHMAVTDQGTNVVVDFISHKAEHEVLNIG